VSERKHELHQRKGQLGAATALSVGAPSLREEMAACAREVGTVGKKVIAAKGNPEVLRELVVRCVHEVRPAGDNWEVHMNFLGSSKGEEWWAVLPLDEPVQIFQTPRVTVYTSFKKAA